LEPGILAALDEDDLQALLGHGQRGGQAGRTTAYDYGIHRNFIG
jgi:hypothetical protein